MSNINLFATASIIISTALLFSCATTPPTTAKDVQVKSEELWAGTYSQDVQPILNDYCVSCHNQQNAANGLNLETYEGVMKGTQYGRVVIPGSPEASTLLTVMQSSSNSEIHMPRGNPLLTKNRIKNIELWIKAGAPKD